MTRESTRANTLPAAGEIVRWGELYGSSPAPARQFGSVAIEAAQARRGENCRWQEEAISHDDGYVAAK